MTARSLLAFTLLAGAALGSWYLARTHVAPAAPSSVQDTGNGGFYLRSARILGTDEAGRLLYEIEADYAKESGQRGIEMTNVRVRYTPETDVPWTIEADQATISGDQRQLVLAGHVVAVSNEGFAGQVTEIRTPMLSIDPERYQAETDSRVQIRIGSRSLTATGMLALLQENRLQLKSNVSGKFIP